MENNEKEKKEKTGWVAELISWTQVLVSAAVIAFVLTTFVIANSEIPTSCQVIVTALVSRTST